jgi:hypothetical protein
MLSPVHRECTKTVVELALKLNRKALLKHAFATRYERNAYTRGSGERNLTVPADV